MSSGVFRLLPAVVASLGFASLCGACKPALLSAPAAPAGVALAPAVTPDPGVQEAIPNLVSLEVALANRYVMPEVPSEVFARLTVRSGALSGQPRPPANIALVVDTSASMRGKAIGRAREAAKALVQDLEAGDRVSVVAFHSRGDVLLESVEIHGSNRREVLEALEGLDATGTTALAEGLSLGMQQLQRERRSDVVSRMVLLSDGVPNDNAAARQAGATLASASVSLTALGLGVDFDEVLLADLASGSGGRYHYVDDGQHLAKIFREEILDIEQLVAQGATLDLRAGPGVSILEVMGRTRGQFGMRTASVAVGDLEENDTTEVVVRLGVSAHRDGASVELLDASLRYSDATAGAGTLEDNVFVAAEVTGDEERRRAGRDEETELVVVRAMTASAALEAVALARAGQVTRADVLIETSEKRARTLAVSQRDPGLTALADDLVKIRGTLPSLAPKPASSASGGPGVGSRAPRKPKVSVPMKGSARGGLVEAQGMRGAHSRAFEALH
ncbi:MAG: vWA domain-containing protein [Nannocystales bacterium]